MQKSRFMLIAGIAMLLATAPLLLTRMGPTARVVHRIQSAYFAAEAPILRPGSGTAETEQFLRDLKAIDTEKAPREVQLGLEKLIVEVAANLEARRLGDTNAANDRVVAAARELQGQFDRHRGNQSDTVTLLAILLVIGISLLIFYLSKRHPAPTPPVLVPLGTNSPIVGAAYYDPASREFAGTILKVDNAYKFADGTIRPSVLVKAKNGAEGWVPVDNMRKMLVEAR